MLQGLLEMLRRLVWPLIAVGILVGILIGLILGWQVWPVRWYDTDPSDLREQHKMSYVIMAADSLAVTGNQELAKRRLADLVDKRNTWEQVANLVERVALEREQAGDSAAALRVRRLAQVVQLPSPKVTPATPAAKPSTRSTRLLIFLLVPEAATQRHLEILSEIAEMLSDRELRERLKAEPDPAKLHQLIANWVPLKSAA